MNAMEKVAWTELLVSVGATVVVLALLPWLGNAALGAFGLLGFLVAGMWFLKQRGQSVIVDERDREIERTATRVGISTAWMALFLALIGLVFWSSQYNDRIVPTHVLTWLVWIQFALCYGIKGYVGICQYRKQGRDT